MRTSATIFVATVMLELSTTSTNAAVAPPCRPLGEIYANGKDLCDNMYGDAYTYVPVSDSVAYDLAYTMWFFTDENPNDATTSRRIASDLHAPDYDNIDVCHLQSGHKQIPGPEPMLTDCHPWKGNACCSDIYSAEYLKELYGPRYRWDKCGTLSQECEHFFVMQACFYQCDANAGLFRYTPPSEYDPNMDDGFEHSEYRLKGMPIKGDLCDSWMAACRHDMFCTDETLDFFSCPLNGDFPSDSPTPSPTGNLTLDSPTAAPTPASTLTTYTNTPTYSAATTSAPNLHDINTRALLGVCVCVLWCVTYNMV